jgi:hypothetical protein
VPVADRRLVTDTEAEAEVLDLFSDVDKTGSTEALIAASLGVKFGFDTFCDQLAPRHSFGVFASGSPLVNGAVPAGATTMNIDGGSAAEAVKKDDTSRSPACSTATVRAPVRLHRGRDGDHGAIAGAKFCPEAPAGGFADNAAITIVKPASGSDYANQDGVPPRCLRARGMRSADGAVGEFDHPGGSGPGDRHPAAC